MTGSNRTTDASPESLRVLTEALGMNRREVAALTGFNERSVGRWYDRTVGIPSPVVERLQLLAGHTEEVVARTVAQLRAVPVGERRLGTYRDDAVFAASHDEPVLRDVPASWHRMVAGRVVMELPDVQVYWIDD